MINLKKRLPGISKLLSDSRIATKITFFMSRQTVGDDFDSYEKNYTDVNLQPISIKGYVHDIKPEALVWKQYGLTEVGAKEVICEDKYVEYFRKANKITIDGDDFCAYKDGMPKSALITKRPFKLIKVVLFKKR